MAKNKVVICSKFFTFAVTKTTSRKSSLVVLDKFTNDANFFVGKRTKKRYENLC